VPLRVVGISGSLRDPSRTSALVRAILDSIDGRLSASRQLIKLADAAPSLLSALARDAVSPAGEAIISAVEQADLLVVGTPVYRASYTGALKHLFDLVHYDALAGKPVVLAATGGNPLHGLVTEHQLRPLLSFFRALTVPTTVYATELDFAGGVLTNPAVTERVVRAASEAVELARQIDRARPTADTHELLVAHP
jgi:FMN reductase